MEEIPRALQESAAQRAKSGSHPKPSFGSPRPREKWWPKDRRSSLGLLKLHEGTTSSVGSDRPDGNSGAENFTDSGPKNATDTNDETQSEKSTAHRRAKSSGGRDISSKSQRPCQGSGEGYWDPQGRESVHNIRIRCKESTEVPGTSDRRGARTAVSLRASIRATGRREKELACQAKEEALYRSERMAQALEDGKEVQRRRKSSRKENKISCNGGQKKKIERI